MKLVELMGWFEEADRLEAIVQKLQASVDELSNSKDLADPIKRDAYESRLQRLRDASIRFQNYIQQEIK